jgi:regulator of sirC expression with transglutaminase-like and TPR domain
VNRRKFDDARVILEQVLGSSPNEGRALALLAQTHLETNKLEDALETANNCVDADAQQAFCWVPIAILEQGENHLLRALEAYHKYLELEPDGRYAKMVRKQITRLEDKVQNSPNA